MTILNGTLRPILPREREREGERERERERKRERLRELLKCHKDGGTFHKRNERNEIRGVGGKIPSNKRRKKLR